MKRTTWTFNVAVDFWHSRKAVMAGRDGRDQFLAALAWSTEEKTDGFVPEGALSLLAGWVGISLKAAKNAASKLVEVGMWDRVDGGWLIHDYEDWQYTAAEREKMQRDNAERQERHRKGRGNALRNALPDPVSNAVSNGVVSRQSLSTSSEILTSSSRGVWGDDDDGRLSTAQLLATNACHEFGRRRHERQLEAGKVRKRSSHLRSCLDNAVDEQGKAAIELALEHPDWTAGAIADELERIDSVAGHPANGQVLTLVQTPDPEWLANRPRCPRCELPQHAGPCPIEVESR